MGFLRIQQWGANIRSCCPAAGSAAAILFFFSYTEAKTKKQGVASRREQADDSLPFFPFFCSVHVHTGWACRTVCIIALKKQYILELFKK